MAEGWTKRESQVVNGVFPLRRFLSGSDHSGVFLTEFAAENVANAAIKLIRVDPARAEAQLALWRMAALLAHPNLIRLFDSGRCQLEGRPFLFVVMEYAEQTLSQILPHRALTPDETQELLFPTLGALGFLHGRHLAQGQLKPPNFLVVNDQLKLASDTIRPVGDSTADFNKSSLYDPPEARDGIVSTAGDIWGLGLTLVEALTQRPPVWPVGDSGPPSLPANIPSMFVETVRQCLSRDPHKRPTVADLESRFQHGTPPAAALAPEPVAVSTPEPEPRVAGPPPVAVVEAPVIMAPEPMIARPVAARPVVRVPADPKTVVWAPDETSEQRSFVPAIAVLVAVVVAVVFGWRFLHGRSNARQSASNTAPSTALQVASATTDSSTPDSPAPTAPSAAPAPPTPPPPPPSRPRLSDRPAHQPVQSTSSVIHEEIPDVPRSARDTIHGHIKIAVVVTVDGSGAVVRKTLEGPVASNYFARLATNAAGKWRFAPPGQNSREWVVQFEFSRSGTTGHAVTRNH
jgi:serine/threonine protein kinase